MEGASWPHVTGSLRVYGVAETPGHRAGCGRGLSGPLPGGAGGHRCMGTATALLALALALRLEVAQTQCHDRILSVGCDTAAYVPQPLDAHLQPHTGPQHHGICGGAREENSAFPHGLACFFRQQQGCAQRQ